MPALAPKLENDMLAKSRLDRTLYSDSDLFNRITNEILQGDYTNWKLLNEVCLSLSFKRATTNDLALKQAIEKRIE